MLAANFSYLINAAIFVLYFLFSKDIYAWPSRFIIWAWIPFVVWFLLHHFFDGVQNTTRNIARIYLLNRDGLMYDDRIVPQIQQALVPNHLLPLAALWQVSGIVSFTTLLFYQGWATAILTHVIVAIFGVIVPINYSRHLRRLQLSFPNTLTPEQLIALMHYASVTDLRSLIAQAYVEERNPQQWWAEVLQRTATRAAAVNPRQTERESDDHG